MAQYSSDASEDAARNAVAILPEDGYVLTHSYSSTVLRALELGMKGRRRFQVYATESYPGMEGKQLAKALVDVGVPVKLVADSAVDSVMPDVDVVLVGADSVLADGSLLHKVGTRDIATAAHERGIPFYSVCETAKFSTADFLGEPVQTSKPVRRHAKPIRFEIPDGNGRCGTTRSRKPNRTHAPGNLSISSLSIIRS